MDSCPMHIGGITNWANDSYHSSGQLPVCQQAFEPWQYRTWLLLLVHIWSDCCGQLEPCHTPAAQEEHIWTLSLPFPPLPDSDSPHRLSPSINNQLLMIALIHGLSYKMLSWIHDIDAPEAAKHHHVTAAQF